MSADDAVRRTLIFAQVKRDLERGLKACDEYGADARRADDSADKARAVEARKAGARRKREATLAAAVLELRAMLEKWQADGGDPNFILTLARLPETLARFVAFYSPLVRKGLVEHRTKALARLRLAQLNDCGY